MEIWLPVTLQTWHHLDPVFEAIVGVGARPIPDPGDRKAEGSLGLLGEREAATAHDLIWFWGHVHGLEALADSDQEPWRRCLAEIQRWAREAYPGDSLYFELPVAETKALQAEDRHLRLLDFLLQSFDHPALVPFFHRIIDDPTFVEDAANRVSLRLTALWLGSTFQARAVDNVLASVYGNPTAATELMALEDSAIENTNLEAAVADWRSTYGLKQPARSPAFNVPAIERVAPFSAPTATVVIPSFRHERFIAATLQSVLGQNHGAIKVIVVDDASDDDTFGVAKAFDDPRLEVRQNGTNLGLGPGIARILDEIDTPFVAILNSDDLFHPSRLRDCLSILEADSDSQIVATWLTPIDEHGLKCSSNDSSPIYDGRRIHDWLRWYEETAASRADTLRNPFLGLLKGNWLLTSSNIVARTSFLRRTAPRWKDLEFTMDWQLFLDAAIDRGLRIVPEALLGYRLHTSNTVWFDPDREWRYSFEVGRVAARTIAAKAVADRATPQPDDPSMSDVAAQLASNTSLSPESLLIGHLAEQAGIRSHDLPDSSTEELVRQVLSRPGTVQHSNGEAAANKNSGTVAHERRVSDFERVVERIARDQLRTAGRGREETSRPIIPSPNSAAPVLDLSLVEERTNRLNRELEATRRQLHDLLHSDEYLSGRVLIETLRSGLVLEMARRLKATASRYAQSWTQSGLRWQSRWPRRSRHRVMATTCSNFPIYSQTFVHQELAHLQASGFELRHAYSEREPRAGLSPRFRKIWNRKRKLHKDSVLQERDYQHYVSLMPNKVEELVGLVAKNSGLTRQQIAQHPNFKEAFTFTRMVEAWRPSYLHSYFFYDRSLHTLIAAFLLDLPRGVSCYADHLLDDYELKLVPLHLRLCQVVVATSERIKQELAELAPDVDPDKILVKPNAIDTRSFPFTERREPHAEQPYRLICVSRLEPKKGLLSLIDATEILCRERGLNLQLHLVGDVDAGVAASEDYRRRIDLRLNDLDLWKKVHLEGRCLQSKVRSLLEMSHLFVAPFVELENGDKDGIPTSLLEAMASGLATVATDAGSIPEVIEDGKQGLIVAQHDPVALADAIQRLIEDPSLRRQMGMAAHERVHSAFDIEVCEGAFHEAIERSILSQPLRRPAC